ncbi:hypothetical protein U9M48_039092 [Paspalum notatum var. saurae]|uniref:Uncharacterized protein n=1 Tax=Paspalum notatum var. saurae TaxID=547442 RepID=A0AAQ3UJZ6_PASNO
MKMRKTTPELGSDRLYSSTVYPGTIMKSKRLEFRHREIRVVSHEAGGALARGGEPGAARRAAEARRGEACDGSLARL